jgi:hypothetical protein
VHKNIASTPCLLTECNDSLFMSDGDLIKSIIKKETAQKDGQGTVMTYEVTTVESPLIIGL